MKTVKEIDGKQVINGTWGELWADGDYLAQATACKAEVGLKTTAVTRTQKLTDSQKVTGIEGKGEIKLHHINSYMVKKLNDSIKNGKIPKMTIVTSLGDPDVDGTERVALYNCMFDKMILADWEAGKLGEESYNFTFEEWDVLQSI